MFHFLSYLTAILGIAIWSIITLGILISTGGNKSVDWGKVFFAYALGLACFITAKWLY